MRASKASAHRTSHLRDGNHENNDPEIPQHASCQSDIEDGGDPLGVVAGKLLPRVHIAAGQTGRKTIFRAIPHGQGGQKSGTPSFKRLPAYAMDR